MALASGGDRQVEGPVLAATDAMSRTSSDVSCTDAAPIFSSRRWDLVVPGMGTIQGSRANSHARAI
jgi:hypothetical protein